MLPANEENFLVRLGTRERPVDRARAGTTVLGVNLRVFAGKPIDDGAVT